MHYVNWNSTGPSRYLSCRDPLVSSTTAPHTPHTLPLLQGPAVRSWAWAGIRPLGFPTRPPVTFLGSLQLKKLSVLIWSSGQPCQVGAVCPLLWTRNHVSYSTFCTTTP